MSRLVTAGLLALLLAATGCSNGTDDAAEDPEVIERLQLKWHTDGVTFRTPDGWSESKQADRITETDFQVVSPDHDAVAWIGVFETSRNAEGLVFEYASGTAILLEDFRHDGPPVPVTIAGADDASLLDDITHSKARFIEYRGSVVRSIVVAKRGDTAYLMNAMASPGDDNEELVEQIVRSLRLE